MRARLILAGVSIGLVLPSAADAYPWMIRHDYKSCASCHVDPSGAGMLTPYGRAQSEVLLRMPWRERGPEEEVPTSVNFLFGAIDLPEWLNLGFSFRGGALHTRSGGAASTRPIQMASDLRAHLQLGAFRAMGSAGFALRRARPASLTPWEQANIVSREHWLGLDVAEQSVLVRAGRIALPFGLRNVEHTSWVRARTRTDINDQQQHGLAIALSLEKVRGEVMGTVGNLQVRPEEYRARGYSAFAEVAAGGNAAVGVSSLMTQARIDLDTRAPFALRQAHGLFARAAPAPPFVLLAEADLLVERPQGRPAITEVVAFLQADLEPTQGLHFIATGEGFGGDRGRGLGGWGSVSWIFDPHAELRVDGIWRGVRVEGLMSQSLTVIAQLHFSM